MRAAASIAALLVAFAPLGARASFGGQLISGKTIAALASQALARLPHAAGDEYVAAAPVADQVVSDGRVHLRAQSPIGTPAFVNVPVQIEVQGHLDRTVLVPYRLARYITTAVAAHDLAAGAIIGDDDVRMARVAYTGRAPSQAASLIGRRAIGNVGSGTPLALNDTAVDQIVKAGSTIEFIVKSGTVTISADAVARSSGGLGDQVYVYNPATRKQLSGTVTGPNQVELNITEDTP